MRASDLFVKCLETRVLNMSLAFPAREMEDLLFFPAALFHRFVPTRHEQGAAFMADMWGRISGQPGYACQPWVPGPRI